MTTGRVVVDTDVAIDYLRGQPDAVAYVESLTDPLLSAVTVAELFSGVRDGQERTELAEFVSAFEVVPVDAAIAEAGGLFRRDYGKSHGVGLPDAVIAAYLKSYGRYGIPFNAVYGPSAPQGIALSELLTPDDVLSALQRARNPTNAGIAPQSPPSGG